MLKKLQSKIIPINILSEYRAELMGYSIFGVLWGHLMNETIAPVIFAQIARLTHTAGFIFLSGFGLYYSFYRNKNVLTFYKKRFVKVFIPFAFIMYFFFLALFITQNCSLLQFFFHTTASAFWIYGETGSFAMWYISVSLFLYLLFPFFYHILFDKEQHVTIRLIYTLLFIAVFLFLVAHIAPTYWLQTRIGLSRFLLFPLGMYAGHLALNNRHISIIQFLLFISFCVIGAGISKLYIDDETYALFRTLIGIPIICSICYFTKKSSILMP